MHLFSKFVLHTQNFATYSKFEEWIEYGRSRRIRALCLCSSSTAIGCPPLAVVCFISNYGKIALSLRKRCATVQNFLWFVFSEDDSFWKRCVQNFGSGSRLQTQTVNTRMIYFSRRYISFWNFPPSPPSYVTLLPRPKSHLYSHLNFF